MFGWWRSADSVTQPSNLRGQQEVSTAEDELDEDAEEVHLPTSKIAAAGGVCQPTSALRKQLEDLRSRHPSRQISPERMNDFSRVLQSDMPPGRETALCACVASILRLGPEDVADLVVEPENCESALMIEWLSSRQHDVHLVYGLQEFRLPSGENPDRWTGMLGILRGLFPRGSEQHSHDVVVRVRTDGTLTIVHDPHHDSAGLASPLVWLALFPPIMAT